jgi:hypothetical protein
MASHDAHLGVLPGEDSKPSLWVPQAANYDVILRFADVVTNGVNHSGLALTNFLRFIVLLPGMVALVIAEGSVRLDKFFAQKLGVQR